MAERRFGIAVDRRAPAGPARPRRSWATRACCCSTSRPPASTSRPARTSSTRLGRAGRRPGDPAHRAGDPPRRGDPGRLHPRAAAAGRPDRRRRAAATRPSPRTPCRDCFGVPVRLDRDGPRFSARIARYLTPKSVSACGFCLPWRQIRYAETRCGGGQRARIRTLQNGSGTVVPPSSVAGSAAGRAVRGGGVEDHRPAGAGRDGEGAVLRCRG